MGPFLGFGELFFKGTWGKPFPRDEKVVADLRQKGLLQDSAPVPSRFEEMRSLARMYEPWTAEVLMDTTMEEASRSIPPIVGSLAETPRGVLLTMRANSLEWMAHVVSRIPWPVEVAGPPELAGALRALAERLTGAAATLRPL